MGRPGRARARRVSHACLQSTGRSRSGNHRLPAEAPAHGRGPGSAPPAEVGQQRHLPAAPTTTQAARPPRAASQGPVRRGRGWGPLGRGESGSPPLTETSGQDATPDSEMTPCGPSCEIPEGLEGGRLVCTVSDHLDRDSCLGRTPLLSERGPRVGGPDTGVRETWGTGREKILKQEDEMIIP